MTYRDKNSITSHKASLAVLEAQAMVKMKLLISMFCSVIISLCIVGCGNKSSSSDSGPVNFSQNTLDSDLVWAVNGGMDQIYNDNLAGHVVGAQNITASCPLGGTVLITGTMGTTSNTGITTVDLTYTMTGCKITKTSTGGTSVSLTLTGVMTHTGSFNSSTNYKSINNQSASLTMVGTAHRSGYNDAAVNNVNCTYSGASTSSGTGGSVSGSICGNTTVSWTY